MLLLLSQGGADATLDCELRRWPEVGFEEMTVDLLKARFWIGHCVSGAPRLSQ
jgi:hypothetical protein